jgi:hypothetical protein
MHLRQRNDVELVRSAGPLCTCGSFFLWFLVLLLLVLQSAGYSVGVSAFGRKQSVFRRRSSTRKLVVRSKPGPVNTTVHSVFGTCFLSLWLRVATILHLSLHNLASLAGSKADLKHATACRPTIPRGESAKPQRALRQEGMATAGLLCRERV